MERWPLIAWSVPAMIPTLGEETVASTSYFLIVAEQTSSSLSIVTG